jgi:hypothetical protein
VHATRFRVPQHVENERAERTIPVGNDDWSGHSIDWSDDSVFCTGHGDIFSCHRDSFSGDAATHKCCLDGASSVRVQSNDDADLPI